jgi:hypothetical protein
MAKLMIGKVMFKPTIIKVIRAKLMIIKLIMAKPTKNKNNDEKKKTKLITIQLIISK